MSKNNLVFEKINYLLMIIGILIIGLGFILMASDSEQYGFGVLGITLGPIVVFLGLIIEFVAILYKRKASK